MTLSDNARRDNMDLALRILLERVGDDKEVSEVWVFTDDAAVQAIAATTWGDLESQGWVIRAERLGGHVKFRLSERGWLRALEVTSQNKSPLFVARLAQANAALKGYVDGRAEPHYEYAQIIAKKAGVPEGWFFNLLGSGYWDKTTPPKVGPCLSDGGLVTIPIRFGMRRL